MNLNQTLLKMLLDMSTCGLPRDTDSGSDLPSRVTFLMELNDPFDHGSLRVGLRLRLKRAVARLCEDRRKVRLDRTNRPEHFAKGPICVGIRKRVAFHWLAVAIENARDLAVRVPLDQVTGGLPQLAERELPDFPPVVANPLNQPAKWFGIAELALLPLVCWSRGAPFSLRISRADGPKSPWSLRRSSAHSMAWTVSGNKMCSPYTPLLRRIRLMKLSLFVVRTRGLLVRAGYGLCAGALPQPATRRSQLARIRSSVREEGATARTADRIASIAEVHRAKTCRPAPGCAWHGRSVVGGCDGQSH